MKHTSGYIILTLALSFTFYGNIYARQMSYDELKTLVNILNSSATYKNMHFELDESILVCNIYNVPEAEVQRITPEAFAAKFEDDIPTIVYENFSALRGIYHYKTSFGEIKSKVINVDPFLLMGIVDNNRRISLVESPKAQGVNVELIPPRGWKRSAESNPATVAHYNIGAGYNQMSFMIQVKKLPVFLSRREVKSLFAGNEICGLTIQQFLPSSSDDIISITQTEIHFYPAIHIKYFYDSMIFDVRRKTYMNVWMIFYEDRIVSVCGSAFQQDYSDTELFDILFNTMSSQIRFPDQFK